MISAIIYLAAITAGEIVTVTVSSVLGIVIHLVILFSLLLHAALSNIPDRRHLFLSVALIPLIRIISLSMPLAEIPLVWWYPIIYAPLVVAGFQVARLSGFRLRDIGLTGAPLLPQIAIAMTGAVFGLCEYFILTDEARLTGEILGRTWLLSAFLLVISTGFVEEFIFRGILQRTAEDALGGWRGIIYVSLLFAVAHWIHDSVLDVMFVFVIAMFFGWAVKKTGSLVGVTLSHGFANIVLFLVAPLLFK